MPSKSGKQHRYMAANCNSAAMRKKTGMSKKVACDFMHADKGKHFKEALDALAQRMIQEMELDPHSRWVLDGGMNTTMEADDPFASWQGVDLQRKHWNTHSADIIDGAIKKMSMIPTAQERLEALQKYADEVGVPYTILYNQIMQDTGNGFFDKDDYMKGHQFQRPTRESSDIMNAYKAAIKKK